MQRRSVITTAAVAAGFGLGSFFGPVALDTTASAQTQPPAQTQQAAPRTELRNSFLNRLAAGLNIQRGALDTAITNAGIGTVDAAVQQGSLTQAQADQLKARIQSGDIGALWGGRGGRGSSAMIPGVKQAMLDAAARTLNITADELTTQLRGGQTLAQLAQAHNTTEQAVIDAALAAAKAQLDQAVAAGTVTQAQADAFYAHLQQEGSGLLHGGGRGRGGPRAQPTDPATPQTPTTTSGL